MLNTPCSISMKSIDVYFGRNADIQSVSILGAQVRRVLGFLQSTLISAVPAGTFTIDNILVSYS